MTLRVPLSGSVARHGIIAAKIIAITQTAI